jgi:hypothetical protein
VSEVKGLVAAFMNRSMASVAAGVNRKSDMARR